MGRLPTDPLPEGPTADGSRIDYFYYRIRNAGKCTGIVIFFRGLSTRMRRLCHADEGRPNIIYGGRKKVKRLKVESDCFPENLYVISRGFQSPWGVYNIFSKKGRPITLKFVSNSQYSRSF